MQGVFSVFFTIKTDMMLKYFIYLFKKITIKSCSYKIIFTAEQCEKPATFEKLLITNHLLTEIL